MQIGPSYRNSKSASLPRTIARYGAQCFLMKIDGRLRSPCTEKIFGWTDPRPRTTQGVTFPSSFSLFEYIVIIPFPLPSLPCLLRATCWRCNVKVKLRFVFDITVFACSLITGVRDKYCRYFLRVHLSAHPSSSRTCMLLPNDEK